MKKWMILTLVTLLPLGMMAQDDDMYFVPTKETIAKEKQTYGMPKNTYYSGSQRSVDDYNSRSLQPMATDPSTGDVINFSADHGVYADSVFADAADSDYQYTRRMSRFDDYTPSEAYWDGYRDGSQTTRWHYGAAYYPWYDSWYDPWYYGYTGWYGYYRPWGYYGWYSYYRPRGWYGWAPVHPRGGRHTGYKPSRPTNNRPSNLGGRNYGGYRGNSSSSSTSSSNGGFGNRPSGGSFGGYRSGSSGGSLGGGSRGGSSSGGGRSATGGRSFGGKR